VPVFVGWFIVAGSSVHLYSPIQGYQITTVFMLLIIAAMGAVAITIQITLKPPKHLWLKSATASWRKFQAFTFVLGLLRGVNAFVPSLMVITLVGKEDTIGLIQSLS